MSTEIPGFTAYLAKRPTFSRINEFEGSCKPSTRLAKKYSDCDNEIWSPLSQHTELLQCSTALLWAFSRAAISKPFLLEAKTCTCTRTTDHGIKFWDWPCLFSVDSGSSWSLHLRGVKVQSESPKKKQCSSARRRIKPGQVELGVRAYYAMAVLNRAAWLHHITRVKALTLLCIEAESIPGWHKPVITTVKMVLGDKMV